MKIKKHIPKDKFDSDAIKYLNTLSFDDVKNDTPELLEWLQDMHWPVAYDLSIYLIPYVKEITQELLFVLKSDDSIWEGNIIRCLLAKSSDSLDPLLIDELKRIAEHPTKTEIEDEIDVDAKNLLSKF